MVGAVPGLHVSLGDAAPTSAGSDLPTVERNPTHFLNAHSGANHRWQPKRWGYHMRFGVSSARRTLRQGIAPLAWLLVVASSGPALGHDDLPGKIATATRRIASASDPAAEFLIRGEFHRLAGEWDAARSDYDRAAALNPALPGLELCLAELMLDQGRFAEAHAALGKLLARQPGEARAWELRSRASEALARPGAAAEDLARAIEITRDAPPDLYVERSRLLVAAGLKAEALWCLDDGVARLGPIVTLELAAVDLELERGNPAGALSRLDQVAAQMERPEKLLARRAEILAAAGDAEAARLASAGAAPERTRRSTPAGGQVIAGPQARPSASAPAAGSHLEAVEPRAGSATERTVADPLVTRGPYLQIGTPGGVTVRWRTDVASPSKVLYGTAVGSLTSNAQDATLTTEHELTLTGLAPDQRYYYAIGTLTSVLQGDDAAHTFVTSPTPGTAKPTRIWIIGDAGTGTSEQAAVRDAFVAYTGTRPADVWLMLGDNAYSSGTDTEYQTKHFDMYSGLLKNTILWPTRGNHDITRSGAGNDYYEFFSMPTAGQAGGLASGTEAYYSFDYGNIHFVCLDSEGSNRSPGGAMATWLTNDIAATARDWVIAFWHHPPYSKGSHDSDDDADSGGRMRDMRANMLPILDSLGVDVVLTGHSHSYERSFLLDRHYGPSTTLTQAMKIDPGDGRQGGDGPYSKATLGTGPHEGCVYAVAGSSGHTAVGSLDHPVMVTSLLEVGSMVMDVAAGRLDARFIDGNGAERDGFTIIKGSGGPRPDTIPPAAISDLGAGGSAAQATGAAVTTKP